MHPGKAPWEIPEETSYAFWKNLRKQSGSVSGTPLADISGSISENIPWKTFAEILEWTLGKVQEQLLEIAEGTPENEKYYGMKFE